MTAVRDDAERQWPDPWLGPPGLYRPSLWKQAHHIKVSRFRQTLIWPLALHIEANAADRAAAVARAVDAAGAALRNDSAWHEIADFRDHARPLGERDREHRYREYLYFHELMWPVLFPRNAAETSGTSYVFRAPNLDTEPAAQRLFRHCAVTGATVTLRKDGGPARVFTLSVSHCNLLLQDDGLVLMVLETEVERRTDNGAPRSLTLADVLDYTAAIQSHHDLLIPDGGTMLTWDWHDVADGAGLPLPGREDLFAHVDTTRFAPVAGHWRALLRPLRFAGYDSADARGPAVRNIVESRIPAMTLLSLAREDQSDRLALWQVSRGDWYRLCYVDASTDCAAPPLPYAPGFLSRFEEEACYDRYFPSEAIPSYYASRFLFAQHHVAFVGTGDFFEGEILHHHRRHYLQVGRQLLGEYAALLVLQDRIRCAIARALSAGRRRSEEDADQRLSDELADIQRAFLHYVRTYRFQTLSNETQPREIVPLWRGALGTEALFASLRSDVEAAGQFLLSAQQDVQNRTTTGLSVLAAVGVVLSLAFAFLGMNVLVGADTFKLSLDSTETFLDGLKLQLAVFGGIVLLAGFGGFLFTRRPHLRVQSARRIMTAIIAIGLIMLVASVPIDKFVRSRFWFGRAWHGQACGSDRS